ncbi:unnamed protein product, partial [Discosporangium mesarthrocarpum]
LTRLGSCLEDASSLHTLVLSRNSISKISQLEIPTLETLDLSYNRIGDASGLENLSRLRWLNLSHNRVEKLLALRPLVPLGTAQLTDVDLTANHVVRVPRYRAALVEMIPSIKCLDGEPV